ncbi:DUF1343 domain-containing protein [bacterium]|nr:DUF1343 domain-containing protein [bacterium]
MLGGIKCVWDYVLSIARICCVLLIALFLPKVFLVKINSSSAGLAPHQSISFRLGLENLTDDFLKTLTPKKNLSFKAGLVTNQSGRNQSGTRTLDVLLKKGINVVSLFAPEHGMDGNISMMRDIQDGRDAKSNINIISMYGNGSPKRFDESQLKDIDVLFFDMQDSGMRHYTFITTMFEMLEAASAYKKVAVIFDRPNLLGPYMEGTLVSPELKSAISYAPIPLRYGMTIGELALYFNKKILKKPAQLHVVPMTQYNRYSYAAQGLLAHLSPNITSMNSCYGYSFLGLLGEIRPFDIGVGTDKAFQCLLLPETIKFSKKKWHELHLVLKKQGVGNSFYRYYSNRKKIYCSGLRLHVNNINSFSAFETLLTIVDFFKKTGVTLTYSNHFDKAAGSKKLRAFFQDSISKTVFTDYINKGLHDFYNTVSDARCFLYQPFPKVVNLS